MYNTQNNPLYSPSRRTNMTPSPSGSNGGTNNSNVASMFNASSTQPQQQMSRSSTLPRNHEPRNNEPSGSVSGSTSDLHQHIETSQTPPLPRSYSTGDLKSSIRAGEQQTKVCFYSQLYIYIMTRMRFKPT